MDTIEGMTKEQVEYNIYAFGADLRRYTRKYLRARKNHTRAYWQKKINEARMYINNNKERLAKFVD